MTDSSRADLEDVRAQLTAWRSAKKGHPRIPEPLWPSIVALADHYPLDLLCRKLKAAFFRKRLARTSPAHSAALPFLDITPTSLTPPASPLSLAARFTSLVGDEPYYTVLLDGTQYFHSTAIECPSCLRQTDAKGVVHCSHQILAATVVKASSHQILPLDVEAIENEDGREKQDCETNAAKRLVVRLRQQHRQLRMVLSGDAIYAHEPMVQLAREHRMKVIFVAKPGSQPETFEWVEELERAGGVEHGSYEEGSGPKLKRRMVEYRFVREVPISQKRTSMLTFVEAWVRDAKGKLVFHNSRVTDLEVTHETVRDVIRIGRSRWKVENEQFNVHKNGGYHLEHNYGHGERGLSMLMVVLNMLAFLLHQILLIGDRLYERCPYEGPVPADGRSSSTSTSVPSVSP